MTYDQSLSWLAASLTWLIAVIIIWNRDEKLAIANERKAREEGVLK